MLLPQVPKCIELNTTGCHTREMIITGSCALYPSLGWHRVCKLCTGVIVAQLGPYLRCTTKAFTFIDRMRTGVFRLAKGDAHSHRIRPCSVMLLVMCTNTDTFCCRTSVGWTACAWEVTVTKMYIASCKLPRAEQCRDVEEVHGASICRALQDFQAETCSARIAI